MSYFTPDGLTALRERREDELVIVAFAGGLLAVLAATLSPAFPAGAGLVVGGLLVGLAARSLTRAVQLGLYFGGFVLVCWGLALVLFGVLGPVVATTPLSALAAGLAVAYPTFAAIGIRGLV